MTDKIRVGIIGTGFGATVHAPIIASHPNFEVVAIASVSRGRTEDIRRETGVEKVYTNWEQMLNEEDLDLVAITSAPFLHYEMTIKAFDNKYHVLCEKPMSMTSTESKEMIEKRDNEGLTGFINFEFRFLPARLKIKEISASGQLGRILHINYRGIYQGYHRAFSRKGWLGQKEFGGGMLGALGSHMIDSLLWWKDTKIESIYGQLPINFPEYSDEVGTEIRTAEDSFQAVGNFQDGTTFSLDFILNNRNTSGWSLEVTGTNGTLIMKDDREIELALEDEPLKRVEIAQGLSAPESMSPYTKKYFSAFYPMLDSLSDAIKNNSSSANLATFEDGYEVQRVLDAIRESAELNKRITL